VTDSPSTQFQAEIKMHKSGYEAVPVSKRPLYTVDAELKKSVNET
jgi:hypothetical protein